MFRPALQIITLLVLAFYQWLDVEMTHKGILESRIEEGNVIVRYIEGTCGWDGVLAIKFGLVVALACFWKVKRFYTWLVLITCVYSLLTSYHLLLLFI